MRACITGLWPTLAAAMGDAALQAALRGAPEALLELRLDAMADVDGAQLRRAIAHFGPQRLVLTCRHPAERGRPADAPDREACLTQAQRRAAWRLGHALGVAYLDVDARDALADGGLRRALARPSPSGRPVRLILSAHMFAGVPALAELWRRYLAAARAGADVVKLACWAADAVAAAPLAALGQKVGRAAEAARTAQRAGKGGAGGLPPVLAIGMGPGGQASRVLAGRQPHPPPFAYVALAAGAGSAAGQWDLATWQRDYETGLVGARTPVYGVLGWPVAHSRSPALHNAVLRRYGRAGVYLPFPVAHHLARFVALAPDLGVRGLSVTLPHKEGVGPLCTPAVASGAPCNTLVRAPASRLWRGTNTDGPALCRSLAARLGGSLAGRRCLVLGTGGTARVAAAALGAAGARVAVWGRRPAASRALAAACGARWVEASGLGGALAHADVVVHCTPVGMAPNVDESLLTRRQLRALPASALVFDAIYTPQPTRLLRLARAAGRDALGGRGMFVRQAQLQCRAFYRLHVPLAALGALLARVAPPAP